MFSILMAPMLQAWFFIKDYLARLREGRTRPRRIGTIEASRAVLRNSTLESRAEPNQRLVTAFGIDNAFTTTDRAYHKSFVTRARHLIRTTDHEWAALAAAAADIVDDALSPLRRGGSGHVETLSLVKFVQSLVFRVVIIKFFPGSASPSAEDVDFITTQINSLWLASKQQKKSSSGREDLPNPKPNNNNEDDKRELLRRLQSFIHPHATSHQDPRKDNPLNWILPAYETLWRVVRACFLEVRFRGSAEETRIYRTLLAQFSASPCQHTFETPLQVLLPRPGPAVSVKDIVDETLRLYPPTRRVHRRLAPDHPSNCTARSSPAPEDVAVNIQQLHRDALVWPDARLFRPSRWAKPLDRRAFMPFGMGVFECPAKKAFGPVLIGVLVGALVEGVDEGWVLEGGLRGGGLLDGGREGGAGLVLRARRD